MSTKKTPSPAVVEATAKLENIRKWAKHETENAAKQVKLAEKALADAKKADGADDDDSE